MSAGGPAGRAACLLGRQVLGGADDRAGLRDLARAGAGDPEVHDLDAAVGRDDDVVRLDVAVDDGVAVRELEGGEDLSRVVDGDPDRRCASGDEQLLERLALEVLHRDVVRPVAVASVVDGHDVGMREHGGALRLSAEALDELLVLGVAFVERLDSDATTELLVLCEVDGRHAPRAELSHDEVATVEDVVGLDVGSSPRLQVRESPFGSERLS